MKRLLSGLEHKFHRVAMDRYFTSPVSFDTLLDLGFYVVGTCKQSRRGNLYSLAVGDGEKRGLLNICVHRDLKMAIIHWSDCKGVSLLTTAADPVQHELSVPRYISGAKQLVLMSPMQILYSFAIRGVEVQDQLRVSYTCQRPTKKWWHRNFCFGLDSATTNTYILYK